MKGLSKIKKGVAGIYKISINEHIYIGQSIDILTRLKYHQRELQKREHSNSFLQNAYNKHKASKVKVQVLYKAKKELFNKEQLRTILSVLEQTFINYYNADLNLQPAYPSNLGNKFKNSICSFNGTLYHPKKGTIRIKNLGKYCRDNNLDSTEMKKVTLGKIDHYKGYFYSEKIYQVYKDRALDYSPLEGIDLPLLTKDTRLINQIMEEILDKKDFYSEDTHPWSNKELTENLFLSYIEKEYPGLLPYILEANRRISEYPVCGFSSQRDPSPTNIFNNVLDVRLDISSYRSLYYPLGNPTILKGEANKILTLKEFLNTYKNELVDKLYTVYIEGLLEHQQDLVFSKYSSLENKGIIRVLKDNYEDDDSYDRKIEGDFLLTSKQLRWGVVTSEVLNILRKVCSHKQWAEWMNLKVTLAIYYPKSSELPLEEWCRNKEFKYWCRFPLEPLITKLKEAQHISDPYKQSLFELSIKTLYATLASPHFPIGNTVVANNITASVRTGSWIMSKALGCKFIVTDGGIYEFDSIPYFKTHLSSFKKPGLQSLFIRDKRWKDFVSTQPLITDVVDLGSFLKNTEKVELLLDDRALKVIQSFCCIYDLDFPFKIEHKITNSSLKAVANPYGKVDYILYTFEGKEVIRIRGVKASEYDTHPKVEALRALIYERPLKFNGAVLFHLIGVNEYIKNPNRFNKDLPGYELSLEYIHKPNKKGGDIFECWEDYHKAVDAHRKRVSAYERRYSHLELTLKPSFLNQVDI